MPQRVSGPFPIHPAREKGQLAFEHNARPELEAIVARLDIDFSEHVRPNAEMFWSRVREHRLLAVARETLGVEWAHTHCKDKKATLAAAMETAFVAGDGVPLGVTKEGRRTCARTRFSVFANSSPTIDTSGLRQTCASPHPAHSTLPSLLPAFRSTADCQITHLMTIRRSQTGLLVCVEISHRILMGPRWVRLGDGSDWRARR